MPNSLAFYLLCIEQHDLYQSINVEILWEKKVNNYQHQKWKISLWKALVSKNIENMKIFFAFTSKHIT